MSRFALYAPLAAVSSRAAMHVPSQRDDALGKIPDDLGQRNALLLHILRLLAELPHYRLAGSGRWWRRFTAELQERPLNGVAAPEEGFQMRKHVHELNVEKLKVFFGVGGSHPINGFARSLPQRDVYGTGPSIVISRILSGAREVNQTVARGDGCATSPPAAVVPHTQTGE
jgi:hypothetical protein